MKLFAKKTHDMKLTIYYILGIIILAIIIPVLTPLIAPWSQLNCEELEIDINSGVILESKYIWFYPVYQSKIESSISKRIKQVKSEPENWKKVRTTSYAIKYSPHYNYHSAAAICNQLELYFSYAKLTPENEVTICQKVIDLWKSDGSYHSSGKYVNSLTEKLFENTQ
jgi:hypothetical protein